LVLPTKSVFKHYKECRHYACEDTRATVPRAHVVGRHCPRHIPNRRRQGCPTIWIKKKNSHDILLKFRNIFLLSGWK